MSTIRIGQVSARKGYRLHAIANGWARCGAGNGRILGGTERDLTTANVALVCKRCRRHVRAEAEAELANETAASGNRYNPARIDALTALADRFKTPAERAQDIDLAARIAATIVAAADVLAQPVAERPRSWAELREAYAATHKPVLIRAA